MGRLKINRHSNEPSPRGAGVFENKKYKQSCEAIFKKMDYVDFFDAETDNILASMDENVCFQVDNKAVANEKLSENRFPELTEDEVDSLYAKAIVVTIRIGRQKQG